MNPDRACFFGWSMGKIERRFVNERELSQYAGLSPRTLQSWRMRRQGPPWVRFGRSCRYDLQQFDLWAAGQPHGGGRPVEAQ